MSKESVTWKNECEKRKLEMELRKKIILEIQEETGCAKCYRFLRYLRKYRGL